jgi:hypothetical protein
MESAADQDKMNIARIPHFLYGTEKNEPINA